MVLVLHKEQQKTYQSTPQTKQLEKLHRLKSDLPKFEPILGLWLHFFQFCNYFSAITTFMLFQLKNLFVFTISD
jgi:hypothetical protein